MGSWGGARSHPDALEVQCLGLDTLVHFSSGGNKARPPPPPRAKWTRRVPHPVLIGHGVSGYYGEETSPARGAPRGAPQRVSECV